MVSDVDIVRSRAFTLEPPIGVFVHLVCHALPLLLQVVVQSFVIAADEDGWVAGDDGVFFHILYQSINRKGSAKTQMNW